MKSPAFAALLLAVMLCRPVPPGHAAQDAAPATASKQRTCRSQLQTLNTVLAEYYMREGGYPASLDELVSRGYVTGPLNDPWGRPFGFALDEPFELRSLGADGIAGTADDLVLVKGRVSGGLTEAPSGPAPDPLDLEIAALEKRIIQRDWTAAAAASGALLPRIERSLGTRHPKTIRVQLMMGTALQFGQSDLARAEALFRNAVAGAEAQKPLDPLLLAGALDHLAGIHQARGEEATARGLQDRAMELLEQRGLQDEALMIAKTHRGQYRLMKGDLPGAAADFRQALQIALPLDLRRRTVAMTNLALAEIRLGQTAEAEKRLREALQLRQEAVLEDADTRNIRISLAALALESNRLDEAIALLTSATSSKQAEAQIQAMAGGHVESRLDFGTVMAYGNLAWAHLLKAKTADEMNWVLDLRASADRLQEKLLAHVLPAASEEQRRAQLAQLAELDEAGISFALRTGNPYALEDAALRVIRGRGRALEITLRSLDVLRRRAGQHQAEFQQLAQIRSRIAAESLAGGTPAPELLSRARDLEVSLGERSAQFGAGEAEVTIDALVRALPVGGVLVQFVRYRPFTPTSRDHWSPARYGAFLIRDTSPNPRVTWIDLGPAEPIEALVVQARQSLQSPQLKSRGLKRTERSPAPAVSPLKSLHDLLIAPLKQAGATSRLLLAPDGALSSLPFAPLIDQQGRYLVETTEFVALSTARSLLRTAAGGSPLPPVLFGNASFGKGPAGMRPEPLPGTAREVRDLQRLLPGALVREGQQASETALKGIHSPEILHLATHGFFLADEDKADPWLRTGLLLTPSKTEDGILTALEAASLDLQSTRLVVLSACETGLGVVRDTEGVYGLPRAMELAGARSVVMTLWQVDDLATQAWMGEFYQLLQAGRPASRALREVQLKFLQRPEWRHPYFWAPFVATGTAGKDVFWREWTKGDS